MDIADDLFQVHYVSPCRDPLGSPENTVQIADGFLEDTSHKRNVSVHLRQIGVEIFESGVRSWCAG
jgi:hypothetical protein